MAFQSRGLLCAAVAAAAAVLAVPAFAHHSAGAFDATKEMTVTGTVKMWRWANPHPEMRIVADKAAPVQGEYIFEYPAPTTMIDRGYSRNFVKVGDQVKIRYRPWRSGNPGGLYQEVTKPDGGSLKVRQ
jgi:hypothetical protein